MDIKMSWSSGLKILLISLIIPSFILLTLLNFTNVGIVKFNAVEGEAAFSTHYLRWQAFHNKSTVTYNFYDDLCSNKGSNDINDVALTETFCRLHTNLMRYITAAFILSNVVLFALGVFLFIIRETKTTFNSKERIVFFGVVFISLGSLISNILLFTQIGVYKTNLTEIFPAMTDDNEDNFKSSYIPSIMSYTGFPLVLQSCMLLVLLLFYFKVVINPQGYSLFGRA